MKKIALFLFTTLMLSSCSMQDDGPNLAYQYAKVTETDLPEFLERGKTYKITVTYLLPSPCHIAAGIEAKRGNTTGAERRNIYVAGVSSIDADQTECEREVDDLEREASFSLYIDEDEDYTFYLWERFDDDGQSIYTVVEIPVKQK